MKKVFWFSLVAAFLFSLLLPALAQDRAEVFFFWGEGCPHCAKEKVFLEKISEKYPEIEIKSYEVYNNAENQELLKEFAEKYNVGRLAVPLTIIGDKYFLGYQDDEITGRAIEEQIESVLRGSENAENINEVKVPFFGEIDLSKMSLPVLTITLGALDGLNPCAMRVLLFLIVLLINARSRKRMWLIGGTFLLASGLVYFMLLSAWLNLFLAISYVNLTRTVIGIFAIGIGAWQIKNFIKYRPGVCKMTDGKSGLQERIKNRLKNQAEKLVFSPFTFAILGGVILLAVGVNLIEFFCSAGLPAVYTRILALSDLNSFSYYLYLLLYTLIFMLDDIIVLSLAIITLSRVGFTEKYNYWATLIGGILILILGLLLIFKPELLMFAV
jgi:thiol-disulfide isomerase/thioredoxin